MIKLSTRLNIVLTIGQLLDRAVVLFSCRRPPACCAVGVVCCLCVVQVVALLIDAVCNAWY